MCYKVVVIKVKKCAIESNQITVILNRRDKVLQIEKLEIKKVRRWKRRNESKQELLISFKS